MAAVQTQDVLDQRDANALTQKMTVLDDVGRARDAADIYTVVSESGASYTVDARAKRCDCSDQFYRNPDGGCKHVRRVEFAIGLREIPEWVNESRIDEQLGDYVREVQDE